MLDELQRAKPASAKGRYLKQISCPPPWAPASRSTRPLSAPDDAADRPERRAEPIAPGPTGRYGLHPQLNRCCRRPPVPLGAERAPGPPDEADILTASGVFARRGRPVRFRRGSATSGWHPQPYRSTSVPERERKGGAMENPRPEKVAVVDEVRSASTQPTPPCSPSTAGSTWPTWPRCAARCASGRRVQDLQEHPGALRRPGSRPRHRGAAHRPDRHRLRRRRRRRRRQGPAGLRPDQPALVVKGGVLGDKLLSADEAKALADLAPREVLLARFAGALAAPMQQFAGLLQALPRNFAYGLAASSSRVAPPAPAPTRPRRAEPAEPRPLPPRHPATKHPQPRPPRPTPPPNTCRGSRRRTGRGSRRRRRHRHRTRGRSADTPTEES